MRGNFVDDRFVRQTILIWLEELSALGGMPFYGIVSLAALSLGKTMLFINLLAAFLLGLLITYAIRIIFPKARPSSRISSRHLMERLDSSSFPSVHSLRATILGVFFYASQPSYVMLAFSAILITLVSYARVGMKKHYVIDVIGGIFFGLIISMALLGLGEWL